MSVVSCLRFWLNFKVVKKYQYKIWQLWKWFISYFCFCAILWKLFIVRKWKALGLEQKSFTSCPPLERFLKTISSIWCHLRKSTQARPMRFSAQFSALEWSCCKGNLLQPITSSTQICNGGQKCWDLSSDITKTSDPSPPTPNKVEFGAKWARMSAFLATTLLGGLGERRDEPKAEEKNCP